MSWIKEQVAARGAGGNYLFCCQRARVTSHQSCQKPRYSKVTVKLGTTPSGNSQSSAFCKSSRTKWTWHQVWMILCYQWHGWYEPLWNNHKSWSVELLCLPLHYTTLLQGASQLPALYSWLRCAKSRQRLHILQMFFPFLSSQVSFSPLKTIIGKMNQSAPFQQVNVRLRIYLRRVRSVHRTALCELPSIHCMCPEDLSGRHEITLGRIVPPHEPRTKHSMYVRRSISQYIVSGTFLNQFSNAFLYLQLPFACLGMSTCHGCHVDPSLSLTLQCSAINSGLATIHGLVHLSICKER